MERSCRALVDAGCISALSTTENDDLCDPTAALWPILEAHREQLLRHSMRLMNGHAADAEDALSVATLEAAESYPPVLPNPSPMFGRG